MKTKCVAVGESALDQLVPVEFRADLVLELRDANGTLVLCIVLEVQRDIDLHKKLSWPAYLVFVRVRTGYPAIVLVVAPDDRVAAWAGETIDLGRPGVLSDHLLRRATRADAEGRGEANHGATDEPATRK